MNFESARMEMVDRQVLARGINNPMILNAMRSIPRECFLPSAEREFAYLDKPLPIGMAQTISQPFVVALMIQAVGLSGDERVLEIGTGSGYAAAVLAHICRDVYTIERIDALAQSARKVLLSLRLDNVSVRCGDGTLGWAEQAPYDAIVVSAGGPRIPRTLCKQLAVRGRMIIPVGALDDQKLMRVTRESERDFAIQSLGDVRFVRLIGSEGWE